MKISYSRQLLVLVILTSMIFCVEGKMEYIASNHDLPFNKVVIWGVKLHSHTHSYIHWAFDRAFRHLGYPTYWLDNSDDISGLDLSNALFLTIGLADQKIPLREDGWYILHNVDPAKYAHLSRQGRCIIMQVYSHDCRNRPVIYLDDFVCYDLRDKTLYMPWATDLLPYEIDAIKKQLPYVKKESRVSFVGTKWGGWQGNRSEVEAFENACRDYGIPFTIATKVDLDEHIANVQTAFLAPAIQGHWQCEHGYIPCRIFKNNSYGQFGITNSETVYQLFHKKILYNPDCYKLFYEAMERVPHVTLAQQYELMDFVRDRHTYVNRIDSLLDILEKINEMSKLHTLVWQELSTQRDPILHILHIKEYRIA